MNRSQYRKELEATDVEEVRRMVQGSIYAPDKLLAAREFLYQHDNKYQRRADIKGNVAILISLLALAVSTVSACAATYIAFFKH